ncbi:FkbM family methyltransferase [Geobacter pelophilus]|uniref:FkbM family methyltransferase n=1 Tax=Geoanaerobacter pelophilus TaxID=60036 RepID=A0AAW4L595_9BACT|nr:FkbM family methyltransferase [Geoanaerobacter pelophilus]MBT0663396.1 FkbM family methyltransferase [Geoanaerobacter pelophilus]
MIRKVLLSLIDTLLPPNPLIKNSDLAGGRTSSMPRWDERITHAKKLGFNVTSCMDVGAFSGTWTRTISDIYPGCNVIAIEPNPHIQKELKRNLFNIVPPPKILQMAVAEKTGTMDFNIWGDPLAATSASLQDHVRGDAENQVTVEVDTLDNIAAKFAFNPELVKLDLQGAEVRALNGSSSLLKSVEMFLVEFGCLNAYLDRATPRQLLDIFYDNDYCLYDIVECHYRPYDGALTGGDFIFVKNSSQLRSYKNWD